MGGRGRRRGMVVLLGILIVAAGFVWGPPGWRLLRYRAVEHYTFPDGGGSIEFLCPRGSGRSAIVWRRDFRSGSFHATYLQPPVYRVERHAGRAYYFVFPGTDGTPDLITDGRRPTLEEERAIIADRRRFFPSLDWMEPVADPPPELDVWGGIPHE